jgi:hypothetical protein
LLWSTTVPVMLDVLTCDHPIAANRHTSDNDKTRNLMFL